MIVITKWAAERDFERWRKRKANPLRGILETSLSVKSRQDAGIVAR
jgi:hypothetical protein